MAKISKPVMVEWELSPEDIAKFFCEMDGEAQAEFFNAIGEEVESWERSLCFQLEAIVSSGILNGGGIAVMREIGEYAEDYRGTLAEAAARRMLINGKGEDNESERDLSDCGFASRPKEKLT